MDAWVFIVLSTCAYQNPGKGCVPEHLSFFVQAHTRGAHLLQALKVCRIQLLLSDQLLTVLQP
jgi:hypothetical protein